MPHRVVAGACRVSMRRAMATAGRPYHRIATLGAAPRAGQRSPPGCASTFPAVRRSLSLWRHPAGVVGIATSAAGSTASPRMLGLPDGQDPTWDVRMLYDGDCPLCMREVDMLRNMDEGKGKIDFVDISAADYDPSKNMGLEFETVMQTIHAILPDGKVITGVEVFRRLYEAVGLGWVYAITKNPTVGALAERVYNFWAQYRMQITGRPALEIILSERKTCRDGGCDITPPPAKK
mmetsp:Transcript_1213/g.2827  ORF Transcript_1213/g.2827 Transcript_1213/m.2827 type:complete len:235 (+) Transcript_1213:2-706(+)